MADYGQIEIGSFTFWPPDKDGEIEIEFNDEVPYGGSRGCCFIHVDKLRQWVAPQNTKETKPEQPPTPQGQNAQSSTSPVA